MAVVIKDVIKNSICDKKGVKKGWTLISINGNDISDVLDYEFYLKEEKLLICFKDGHKTILKKITKSLYDEIGLEFETYLMDAQRSCANRCIFCFIDQLPTGMRNSLYFKDDDSRLSFLMGNYITLTNLKDKDIERIIKMHISPINISVHTMNPELRVEMMKNKRAGECLKYIKQLADANIKMNIQLVLCRGINDGDELRRSLTELSAYAPQILSIAAVPVGLTKYRDGLYNLQGYDKESSREVVDILNEFGDKFIKEYGTRLCYPADEFFIKSEYPIPDADYYEEFSQIENGVGMWASFRSQVIDAMIDFSEDDVTRNVSVATSVSAYKLFAEIVDLLEEKWHNLHIDLYSIENDFFGHSINVAGLITGQDYFKQLIGKPLGDELFISTNSLKNNEDVFLDDMTLDELSQKLNVKITPVENDGYIFVTKVLGK
ncbi:MAG: DUF512 domain-containing protein [Clostridia bacterium]|nr:DUF512 domain-containing protein [Clostridia bacterium]